jgi:hypothetical protein
MKASRAKAAKNAKERLPAHVLELQRYNVMNEGIRMHHRLLAEAIAKELFTARSVKKRARRLVFEMGNGSDQGGWGIAAATLVIERIINTPLAIRKLEGMES